MWSQVSGNDWYKLFRGKLFVLFDKFVRDHIFYFVYGCECDTLPMLTPVFNFFGHISSDGSSVPIL